MTKPVYVLNGPNLNRLGTREPEIYGRTTLAEVEALCRRALPDQPIVFRQSNKEHELIEWIHEAIDEGAGGIVINPAAFTFTSMAIMDALKMFPGPIIEVHITNIHRREADLPPLLRVARRDGRDRRSRRAGLRGGGPGCRWPARMIWAKRRRREVAARLGPACSSGSWRIEAEPAKASGSTCKVGKLVRQFLPRAKRPERARFGRAGDQSGRWLPACLDPCQPSERARAPAVSLSSSPGVKSIREAVQRRGGRRQGPGLFQGARPKLRAR